MKFTLSWLKEHLDTEASLTEITEALTMIGLELEGVEDRAKGLEDFVVGEVLTAEKHPDADKLQVLTVNNGKETLQVVCGAPNARKGLKGVFGGSGMYVPGIDFTLKPATIRGVDSNGMMLSEREMGLSDAHDGIVELDADAEVGAPAVDVMGLNDPVIEIAITPNRGDCLGVRGVARDLAAAGIGTLKPLNTDAVEGKFESPKQVHLDFTDDAKDACPMFVGRYIKGVKNGPSPKWLQDRLLAIGLRPISALVDITNLVTYDLCRPLHVFDADKVHGDIHVRFAKPGEKILALDGKEYELDDTMTVIADEKVAEAIAGVMGGEVSGCTEETVNVFLETAYFDSVRTATTGRKLNLQSDARYRFERGVDPSFLHDATEIATRLILNLCGGEPSNVVVAGEEPDWRREIVLRKGRVEGLTGVSVEEAEIERILTVVGCEVSRATEDDFVVEAPTNPYGFKEIGPITEGDFIVQAPAWRPDIQAGHDGEAALVEEVVRLVGYDRIEAVPLERPTDLPTPALTVEQQRRSTARRLLATRGMIETVTYSFLPSDQAELFGGGQDSVRLVNPISSDLDIMRPSILPNLIAAAGRNADRGLPEEALFEVGPQFAGDGPEDQAWMATGIRSVSTGPRNWAQPSRPVDVFDAKADALAILEALGVSADKVQIEQGGPDYYHPGRVGTVKQGPKNVLATFGEIHPGILKKMGVKGPIVGFEVHVDNLPKPKAKKSAARPLLKLASFQPVERDFAFVVDSSVAAGDVLRAALGADKGLIVGASVFDVFEGESLGANKKSVAINVTLQPTEKTLTDEEIEAVSKKVIDKVTSKTGGELRS